MPAVYGMMGVWLVGWLGRILTNHKTTVESTPKPQTSRSRVSNRELFKNQVTPYSRGNYIINQISPIIFSCLLYLKPLMIIFIWELIHMTNDRRDKVKANKH